MGYFPVRYDSRVVIFERRMFIRLATGWASVNLSSSSSHVSESSLSLGRYMWYHQCWETSFMSLVLPRRNSRRS